MRSLLNSSFVAGDMLGCSVIAFFDRVKDGGVAGWMLKAIERSR